VVLVSAVASSGCVTGWSYHLAQPSPPAARLAGEKPAPIRVFLTEARLQSRWLSVDFDIVNSTQSDVAIDSIEPDLYDSGNHRLTRRSLSGCATKTGGGFRLSPRGACRVSSSFEADPLNARGTKRNGQLRRLTARISGVVAGSPFTVLLPLEWDDEE
jgi:hypothetical protein